MTRTMGDAVDVTNLPSGLDLYAGYINGVYTAQNYSQLRARFPTAHILTVSVNASLVTADIADCENGDYTPKSAAQWAKWMHDGGKRPTVYCNRGNYGSVASELTLVGLLFGLDVDCWLSTLDGTKTSNLPGVVAIQYTDNGGLWDETIVYSDTWHPTTPPSPTPPITLGDNVQAYPFTCTLDANGWTAVGVTLPPAMTKNNVVSVVVDGASPYDNNQPWELAVGTVDYNTTGNDIRVIVKGTPGHFYSGRVYAA